MNIPKQPTIPPIPTHKKATIAEPCDDCIKREDALMALTGEWTEPTDEIIHRFVKRIKNLPPVTPAEKVGHWIETAEEYYKAVNEYGGGVNKNTPYFVDDIACSKCLTMFSTIDNETERFEFCPNCGAKVAEGSRDDSKRHNKAI